MQYSTASIAGNIGSLSVEDRLNIQELMSLYLFCDDNGDAETYASLYTEDGTFIGLGKPPVVGRANLVAFAQKRWELPENRKRSHWLANVIAWATPEGAAAKSYQMTVEKVGNTYKHSQSGKHDELRRVNGVWRFHVRRVVEILADP